MLLLKLLYKCTHITSVTSSTYSLLDGSPLLVWPNHPSPTSSAHRLLIISSFASVIITTAARGCRLTINVNVGHNRLLMFVKLMRSVSLICSLQTHFYLPSAVLMDQNSFCLKSSHIWSVKNPFKYIINAQSYWQFISIYIVFVSVFAKVWVAGTRNKDEMRLAQNKCDGIHHKWADNVFNMLVKDKNVIKTTFNGSRRPDVVSETLPVDFRNMMEMWRSDGASRTTCFEMLQFDGW